MAKSRPTAARVAEVPADPLAEAVTLLANEVGCVGDVLEGIRSELQWIARNGLPIQRDGDQFGCVHPHSSIASPEPHGPEPSIADIVALLERAISDADESIRRRCEQALAILSPSEPETPKPNEPEPRPRPKATTLF